MFAIDKRLGIAVGIVGGLALWIFMRQLEKSYQETTEMVSVLVAKRYIPRGTALRSAFFKPALIPKAYVPAGAITSFEVLESSGRLLWRNSLSLPEGTPLAEREVVSLTSFDAFSYQIGENQVAVSFGVDRVRGLGGNLQPGDLIDILHTVKPKDMNPATLSTQMLFQSVRLVAIGQRWNGSQPIKEPTEFSGEEETIVLTVLLHPVAAIRLAQVRENEFLSVILRAPNDIVLQEVAL